MRIFCKNSPSICRLNKNGFRIPYHISVQDASPKHSPTTIFLARHCLLGCLATESTDRLCGAIMSSFVSTKSFTETRNVPDGLFLRAPG